MYLLSVRLLQRSSRTFSFPPCVAHTLHIVPAPAAHPFSSAKKTKGIFSGALGHHLLEVTKRYRDLEQKLANSTDLDHTQLTIMGKELSSLSHVASLIDERLAILKNTGDLAALEKEETMKGTDGEEMASLAKLEREEAMVRLEETEVKIVDALTPKDDADERGVVIEVRAGTGGDEASLFASEVFKMYQKFAFLEGWRWEELSFSKSDIGGFKEAQASITGDSVFQKLKFESGVHRVQRIPVNDVKIQTSAASVIVLPEAQEVDVELRPQDLRIDVFRAGGAGGQSVNRTESAVRITHLPSGLVVSMQDERSQIQNRARAMKYLRAKVYDLERKRATAARQELKAAAQGTGDRSDKIRTYNFPQDRVTDHRVGVTITGVERVLSGESISGILDALMALDKKERLESFLEQIERGKSVYK